MQRARERAAHMADAGWLGMAASQGGAHWVANAPCRVGQVQLGDHQLPVTVLDAQRRDTSYVVSARSAWHRYALHEALRRLPASVATRVAANVAAAPLSALIAAAWLDDAVVIDNWMLSTNLHPPAGLEDWRQLTEALVSEHPARPLMLRNVCEAVQPGLPAMLQGLGYRLLPARLVYLADPLQPALWRHNHVKKDQRLLASPGAELVTPRALAEADLPALRECFRSLFIDKHSPLNPDFTPAFFAFCRDSGFLDLFALRHDGRIVGVLGIYARHGWLTTPLIGYDTSLPAELGLYRRLMALLLHEARERKCQLHYSSGAGSFKRVRGGQPQLEYTAIYGRHLGALQRGALLAFAGAMNRWAPGVLARAG